MKGNKITALMDMRKFLIMILTFGFAISAGANDHFYIEDFSITPGKTLTVSIQLNNETAYTAFRADIYLPEGLSVEQLDGNYIFDLTSRKSSDHLLSVTPTTDGAIHIMSFSPSNVAFNGNSGPLVTFNLTTSTEFNGPAIISLKNAVFTDLNEQETPFGDESCQVQPELSDLSGEIVFENGGEKTSALGDGYNIIDMYEYLYISYSGDEVVDFSIYVNGRDLLNDEEISNRISWDEDNKRYVVSQYRLILPLGDQYCALLNYDVTVHAPGYNDLSQTHSSIVSWINSDGLKISEIGYTDLSYLIQVDYFSGVHYCNLDDDYQNYNNDWEKSLYALPRLDYDYSITVIAGQRSPMGTVYAFIEDTISIPAKDCSIAISQYKSIESGLTCHVIEDEYSFYTEEELGGCFAVIESNFANKWDLQLSITVDDKVVWNDDCLKMAAINLLPLSDIYGGAHHIEASVTDGYNTLLTDTIIGIHPVETRLTCDSLFLDIASNMNNLSLIVDGQKVELSNENYCSFPRLDQDYSITVQAGVEIITEWGESYTRWSEETSVIIPSRLIGDINNDGSVNIDDVTDLIDYLLNGFASGVSLSCADCNVKGGDGCIDISDVTALINYLLNGNWN